MQFLLLFAEIAVESSIFSSGIANYGNLVGSNVGKPTKKVPTAIT